jgi:hypothetical protein
LDARSWNLLDGFVGDLSSENRQLMKTEIDDGDVMFMWLGADVEESNWRDLFGVSTSHELTPVPVITSSFTSDSI